MTAASTAGDAGAVRGGVEALRVALRELYTNGVAAGYESTDDWDTEGRKIVTVEAREFFDSEWPEGEKCHTTWTQLANVFAALAPDAPESHPEGTPE